LLQNNCGAWVSLTVTVKAQLFVFPALSVAEQLTVVIPAGKFDPDGGRHRTGTFAKQLSVAVTVKVTLLLEHRPGSAVKINGFSAAINTSTSVREAPEMPEPMA